jgi:hypothetical protein
MTTRPTRGLLAALALTAAVSAPAAGQAMAMGERPTGGRPTTLADAYHLTLRSAWPQLGNNDDCRNGGDEMVEGTLTRNPDGTYAGTFDRRTLLLFCGAHASTGEACELVLEGTGRVAMSGVVVAEGASPGGSALRLSWRPMPAHGATVRGACSADFKRSVEAMYLTVRHGAEVMLPVPGMGRRTERLENYAWTVEIE